MSVISKSSLKSIRVFHACMSSMTVIIALSYIESYTSPIEDQILEEGTMTVKTFSLFATSIFIGGPFGSLFAGPICEWLGILTGNILVSLLGTLGGILLVWAHDDVSMIIGRIFIGLYMGFAYSSLSIYNAEVTPPSTKTFYVSLMAISIRVGMILSSLLGIWIGYRWLVVVYLTMVVLVNINFVFLPESPKWLRTKGYTRKADLVSEYFHDSTQENSPLLQDPDEEIQVTNSTTESNTSTLSQKISSYLTWPILRPLLVCTSSQCFRSFSTHEYLSVYAAHALDKVVSINSRVAAFFYPVSLFVGSIVFLWIIHRVSWKKLLTVTTIIQILTNSLFSINFYLSINRLDCVHNTQEVILCQILDISPLLLIVMYALSFSIGTGSITWWLYGHILHPNYTTLSAGIVTFLANIVVLTNQIVGPMIAEYFGSYVLFIIYTVFCVIALVVQFFY